MNRMPGRRALFVVEEPDQAAEHGNLCKRLLHCKHNTIKTIIAREMEEKLSELLKR